MSRIRSIKPEIWSSADVRALSPVGRLVFIWLITQADDDGRLKTDVPHIAWGAGVSDQEVTDSVTKMTNRGMAVLYEVKGASYIQLHNFARHQKVDHKRSSNLPQPPRSRSRRVANSREQSRTENEPAPRILPTDPTDPTDQTETRGVSDSGETGWEPPMQNPSVEIQRVVDYVHGQGWLCTNSDYSQLARAFRSNPPMLAEDWIGTWEDHPGLANPWALAFTRSGKDPKNCTLVELRMRRRVEGIEAARHKAVREEERQYAAGTP